VQLSVRKVQLGYLGYFSTHDAADKRKKRRGEKEVAPTHLTPPQPTVI